MMLTTRTYLLTVVTAVVLCACGGGGGGSSTPPTTAVTPPPAPSATPAALYASAGSILSNQSTEEFPIFGAAFTSPGNVAFGDVAGGRRVNSDGSISLTFSTHSTPRSVHFTNADISSRNLDGTTARANDVGYFELAAADEPLNGGTLAYARAGAVTFDDATANALIASPFYFGFATPVGAAPSTGTASYRGGTFGYDLSAFTPTLLGGDVYMEMDFASNKLIGHISDLQEVSSGGTSTAYSKRFVFNNVTLSRNAQDVTFSGGAKAVDMSTGTISNIPNDSAGRPAVQGRLFGPNAEEAAGLWQYNDGTGNRLAWGSFATRTESASHPSGALSSPLTFPGSWTQSFTLRTGSTFFVGFGGFLTPILGWTSMSNSTGSLAPDANGGMTLSFAHDALLSLPAKSGSVTFAAADFTRSNTHSRLGEVVFAVNGTTSLWLGDRGALSYSRYGYWADQVSGFSGPTMSTFYAGRETLPSQLPITGSATYRGSGLGLLAQTGANGSLTRISGDVQFDANFAASTISGAFSVRNSDHVHGIPATSLPFNRIEFGSTSFTAGAFSSTSAVPMQGATAVGSGSFGGRFYGPSGEEVAGHWNVNGTAFQSSGAFGAAR